jgi:hypothetical protein
MLTNQILTFRSPTNPDCLSAFVFRTVWIFRVPSGKNFKTFDGKNVTDIKYKPILPACKAVRHENPLEFVDVSDWLTLLFPGQYWSTGDQNWCPKPTA